MANFDNAIPVILAHEGGFVNDPADPGGATKYGISLYWLQSLGELDGELQGDLNHDGRVDINDIKMLTVDTASDYYRDKWWDRYGYERVNEDAVATKIFDMAVNMGGIQAHKIVQRSAGRCGQVIVCDGKLGALSISAVNAVDPDILLPEVRHECADFYRLLAVRKPRLDKFLDGWLVRAKS